MGEPSARQLRGRGPQDREATALPGASFAGYSSVHRTEWCASGRAGGARAPYGHGAALWYDRTLVAGLYEVLLEYIPYLGAAGMIGLLAPHNRDGERALAARTPRLPLGRCRISAAGSLQRGED